MHIVSCCSMTNNNHASLVLLSVLLWLCYAPSCLQLGLQHDQAFVNTSLLSAYCSSTTDEYLQGRNHVVKVGDPILWSTVLLSFYRKNRQVYLVWFRRLHNHTLFIKKLCKKLGVRPNFGEIRTPLTPSGCAHEYLTNRRLDR